MAERERIRNSVKRRIRGHVFGEERLRQTRSRLQLHGVVEDHEPLRPRLVAVVDQPLSRVLLREDEPESVPCGHLVEEFTDLAVGLVRIPVRERPFVRRRHDPLNDHDVVVGEDVRQRADVLLRVVPQLVDVEAAHGERIKCDGSHGCCKQNEQADPDRSSHSPLLPGDEILSGTACSAKWDVRPERACAGFSQRGTPVILLSWPRSRSTERRF